MIFAIFRNMYKTTHIVGAVRSLCCCVLKESSFAISDDYSYCTGTYANRRNRRGDLSSQPAHYYRKVCTSKYLSYPLPHHSRTALILYEVVCCTCAYIYCIWYEVHAILSTIRVDTHIPLLLRYCTAVRLIRI